MRETTAKQLRNDPPRSWLLVPALRAERMLPRAYESGADIVVLDLEAATPPTERAEARRVMRRLGRGSPAGQLMFVRVNDDGSADVGDDEAAAVEIGADGVVLPHVQSPDAVSATAARLTALESRAGRPPMAIVPMLETARGLFAALAIASAHERVAAVALGGEDLAADLGATRTAVGVELSLARGLLVMAAAAAGVASVDTPWLDLDDPAGAGREAAAVAALGITGKFVIHPAQVEPVNMAFQPTEDDVIRAHGVVAAYEAGLAAGTGIAVFEGRMIDEPIARNARRTLRRSARP